MRIVMMAVASLMASGGTVLAADLSPVPHKSAYIAPPAASWTGFHFGVNAGGGFAKAPSDFSLANLPPFGTAPNTLRGAFGGIQSGYTWQHGALAFGIETDFQFAGVKGSIEAPCHLMGCGAPIRASYGHDVSWFGTLRGRVGYATEKWMIYATGGYAYARLNTTAIAAAGPAEAIAKWHDTVSGWAVGAGAELALSAPWSLKLEYLYADYGRSYITWTPVPLPAISDSTHLDMHIVRAGVNYRF